MGRVLWQGGADPTKGPPDGSPAPAIVVKEPVRLFGNKVNRSVIRTPGAHRELDVSDRRVAGLFYNTCQ